MSSNSRPDIVSFRKQVEKEIVLRTRALLRSEEVAAARRVRKPDDESESRIRIQCPTCGFTFRTSTEGAQRLEEKWFGFRCPNCGETLQFKH